MQALHVFHIQGNMLDILYRWGGVIASDAENVSCHILQRQTALRFLDEKYEVELSLMLCLMQDLLKSGQRNLHEESSLSVPVGALWRRKSDTDAGVT